MSSCSTEVVQAWLYVVVCLCMHLFVNVFLNFSIFRMHEWMYFNDTYSLPGSRDADDIFKILDLEVNVSHRNLVNSIVPVPVKGFEPKLMQIFPTVWPQTV